MAISDALPDRPLTLDELHKLQSQDAFDSVTTADNGYDIDVLFCRQGETEYTLHFTEEEGWHHCDTRSLEVSG